MRNYGSNHNILAVSWAEWNLRYINKPFLDCCKEQSMIVKERMGHLGS